MEAKFIETIRDCYLHQYVEKVTCRHGNDNPSLIDLVFTDEEMQVSEFVQHPPLGNSDHNVITFKFNCYLDYSKPRDVYAYTKGNYEAMRNHLDNCEWAQGKLYLENFPGKTKVPIL